MSNTPRLQYIDALKGFLIITVVAGHIIQYFFNDSINNQLFRIIYSFHMPMFMFLSGYVGYKPNQSMNWKKSLTRRFFQLILPFFVWTFVVNPLMQLDFDTKHLVKKIIFPDTGLWFLWVLFFIYAFYVSLCSIAEKFRFNQSLMLLGCALALFGIYLVTNFRYFGFQFISWYFMPFTLGILFNRYQTFMNKYWKYLFVVSVIVFPVLAWNWQMKQMPVLFGFTVNNNLWLYAYKFLSVIFAIPFFMYMFQLLNEKMQILKVLGRNTLGIYAIHFLLLSWIVKPIHTYTAGMLNPYLFLIVTIVLVVAICNFCVLLIRKVSVFAWLLLGEKTNK
jgi:fucose 4-O-acetylase-like acetyltransferase